MYGPLELKSNRVFAFFLFYLPYFIHRFGILEKLGRIFVFAFLAIMALSVLLSIPLLEEEIAHNKIELSKKLQSDKAGDENADDNPESEDWGYFSSNNAIDPIHLDGSDCFYMKRSHSFCNFPQDKSTPPPKI